MTTRESWTYRWNEDLQRVEYWEYWSDSWMPSIAGYWRDFLKYTHHPVVEYEDTWCEPMGE